MFFVKISATTKSSESIFFFKPRACVLVFTSALLLTVCKTSRITSNDVQTAWILSALCGHKWISRRVFVCHSHSLALMASLFVSFTIIVVKNRITFKALKFYSFSLCFEPRIVVICQSALTAIKRKIYMPRGYQISSNDLY